MKPFLVLIVGLLAAWQCAAQPSTFTPATGVLDIPCVAAFDGSKVVGVYTPYQVRLRRIGASLQFSVEQIQPVPFGDDCTGGFDTATNLYTDVVNIGDDSYDARLRRGTDNMFSIESVKLRGPATTSLWVARSGNNTVYLAGTIHALRYEDYPLPRAFNEAYALASVMYFEIDMDNPAETGANLTPAQFHQLMRDPQGRTLAQVLTPGTYSLLRDYLAEWGLPIESVNQWSAQMLVNNFSYWELEAIHGFAAEGVDEHFANRAQRDQKPVHGLETAASQYTVLQTMDEGIEDAVVLDFLDAVATGAVLPAIEDSLRLWRSGATTELDRLHLAPMKADDHADYLLLQVNRNNAWIPQIEALLQTPATEMVMVGVAHMAGPDGLIAQLRKRGYHIEKY